MVKSRLASIAALVVLASGPIFLRAADARSSLEPAFQTSDRCVACHNGMKTKAGEDYSIGVDWRASIMANSSRDPYWQGSVRRETIDHPQATADIQDECSHCHMPMTYYDAHWTSKKSEVFSHLPFDPDNRGDVQAADGVSCSVCHQISKKNLGTRASFVGNFVIEPPETRNVRPEHGPFVIDNGHQRVMQSSTGGFVPGEGMQIRDSALCATCHTLYTTALDRNGKRVGTFPSRCPIWSGSTAITPARIVVNRATCPKCKGKRQSLLFSDNFVKGQDITISWGQTSSCCGF